MGVLTARQRTVLEYVIGFIKENEIPPTLREIGAAMGIGSTNGVNDHLYALMNKGYLHRRIRSGKGSATRSLRLTDKAKKEFGLLSDRDRVVELRAAFGLIYSIITKSEGTTDSEAIDAVLMLIEGVLDERELEFATRGGGA